MTKATKSYRVEFRASAVRDLRAVVRHIGRNNPARAQDFRDELLGNLLPLAQHPEMGRLDRPGLRAGMHQLVVHRNYIVFHQIQADAGIVEIVQVKHIAQQMP